MILAAVIITTFAIIYLVIGIIWLTSKIVNRNNPPPPPRHGATRVMSLEEFITSEETRHGR